MSLGFPLLRVITILPGLFMVLGTLLSLSRHPHWFIRGWDFPRLQIVAIALASGGLYALFFAAWTWYDGLFLGSVAACIAWQAYKIGPYTPLVPVHVKRSPEPRPDDTLRLLSTNVQLENDQYERWRAVVEEADPDVLLALEVDARWLDEIRPLEPAFPYTVYQPQDNYYGMALLSRLELIDPEVRFLVQDDIPSIRATVALRSGRRICLYGVHPRPPEPVRNQDAAPRDAELVLVGREIGERDDPTIVVGDFNDVGWSRTTELFTKVSRLLDPRVGRGFFNTFDANKPLFRFPLDHVFHSNHFKLVTLERLPHVGSDHFPMLIALSYEPDAPAEQPALEQKPQDQQEAQEKVEEAAEDDDTSL